MKPETPYSRFENTISPNYNELKNFKTPQVLPKGETSEMILSQTKASLHNFLANLKKGSTMNDILNRLEEKAYIRFHNGFILSNFHRDLPGKKESKEADVRNSDSFLGKEGSDVPF